MPPLGSFFTDILYALGKSAARAAHSAVENGIQSVLNDVDATADDVKKRVARVRARRNKQSARNDGNRRTR